MLLRRAYCLSYLQQSVQHGGITAHCQAAVLGAPKIPPSTQTPTGWTYPTNPKAGCPGTPPRPGRPQWPP